MYGANTSLFNLIESIAGVDNIDVRVLCPRHGDLTLRLSSLAIPVTIRPFSKSTYYVNSRLSYIKSACIWVINQFCILSMTRKVLDWKIDFIHSNSMVVDVGSKIARKAGIRHIWHFREFGMRDYQQVYFPAAKSLFNHLKHSRKIIAISNSILEESVPKKYHEKTVVLGNPIMPISELMNIQYMPSDESVFIFGIVGRIQEEKNQMEGLKAFAHLKSLIKQKIGLRILGDGKQKYLQKLKKFVHQNDLGQDVEFMGFVRDRNQIYRKMHALIVCAKHEAFGRVTLEAMAYGVPVIVYDAFGIGR